MTTGGTRRDARDALDRAQGFRDLASEIRDDVFARMTERRFAPSETMIHQGDPGEFLLVVVSGEAFAAVRAGGAAAFPIARFTSGDVVGEMAILTQSPRSADVVADRAGVRALRLEAKDFQELAFANPELGVVLTSIVADRLGSAAADGMGGKIVGPYRIVRCVGRGGMAVVYEARDVETDERVALKMMSHRLVYEPGALARFKREAQTLQSLEHPNIARVHRTFTAFRTSFYAMEFCDGPDLAALRVHEHADPEGQTRRIVGQLAAALAHMHAAGFVHRDIKPSNVLVVRDGTVRLTDFGLAKSVRATDGPAITQMRSIVGTPLYMAPEQFDEGASSGAADLYGLGCVAHEMLTGAPPVQAAGLGDLLRAKQAFRLPPRESFAPRVAADTHAFLDACLRRDAAERVVDLARIADWAGPADVEHVARTTAER